MAPLISMRLTLPGRALLLSSCARAVVQANTPAATIGSQLFILTI